MSTENTGVFRIPNLLPPEAEPTQLQDKGLEGLYSPLGFQYAWQDYQSHVINELNQRLTEGMFDQ
jgi:superoxide dismutase